MFSRSQFLGDLMVQATTRKPGFDYLTWIGIGDDDTRANPDATAFAEGKSGHEMNGHGFRRG